jgi:hypothetical protein
MKTIRNWLLTLDGSFGSLKARWFILFDVLLLMLFFQKVFIFKTFNANSNSCSIELVSWGAMKAKLSTIYLNYGPNDKYTAWKAFEKFNSLFAVMKIHFAPLTETHPLHFNLFQGGDFFIYDFHYCFYCLRLVLRYTCKWETHWLSADHSVLVFHCQYYLWWWSCCLQFCSFLVGIDSSKSWCSNW